MTGTIAAIDRQHQRGVILGEDRRMHPFERDNLVPSLLFEYLALVMTVRFEVDTFGRAVNIELSRSPMAGMTRERRA
jgi:hypothetical protein